MIGLGIGGFVYLDRMYFALQTLLSGRVEALEAFLQIFIAIPSNTSARAPAFLLNSSYHEPMWFP